MSEGSILIYSVQFVAVYYGLESSGGVGAHIKLNSEQSWLILVIFPFKRMAMLPFVGQ